MLVIGGIQVDPIEIIFQITGTAKPRNDIVQNDIRKTLDYWYQTLTLASL